MANATGDHDWLNMRPPFTVLDESDVSKIEKSLHELGFALPSVEVQ
jgi:hypothetical protein